MALAGLTMAGDPVLRQEALRFSERSRLPERLSAQEEASLDDFLAVLNRKEEGGS